MKILIVSYSFPPENVIGAVRVGKFAKYLHERGHGVRILAAPPGADRSLPLEVPLEHIVYAVDSNIDTLLDPVIELFCPRRRTRLKTSESGAIAAAKRPLRSRNIAMVEFLRRHYYALLRVPDSRAGWRKDAMSAGQNLLAEWRPDLIFASSPPTISLFVAAALGKRFRIPWIAELRDLWTDNPYYAFPAWRRALDRVLERRVLRGAVSLVTVTPPWGRILESTYDKPISVVLNGYAEEDCMDPQACRIKPGGPLSDVYTGNIYRGFRDPSPLFAAIGKLTHNDRTSISVDFYGSSVVEIRGLVERHGVDDCVRIHAPVTYGESLQLQRDADVLLLLQWNNPRDAGNIPAKFFEYIAAQRPILLLGYGGGVLAQMIQNRRAGIVSNDPDAIAAQLSAWIEMRRSGAVPRLDAGAKAGLSRTDQFRKLEELLADLVRTVPRGTHREGSHY